MISSKVCTCKKLKIILSIEALFSKVSIKPAKDINDFALPLKQTETGPLKNIKDPKKYGGYTDLSFSCFTIFKSDGKEGNVIYTLIAIPGIVQKLNISYDIEHDSTGEKRMQGD